MPANRQHRRRYWEPTLADLRRHLSCHTPQEVWEAIEEACGPPDLIPDEWLRDILLTRLRIAEIFGSQSLWVPDAVAVRIFQNRIDKARSSARAVNRPARQKVIDCNKLLKRWQTSLQRRPQHRPKKHYAAWQTQLELTQEFKLRRRELINRGFTREQADEQAAAETVAGYSIKPATLMSWASHPGRRRSR
jgi:hypothetical protein